MCGLHGSVDQPTQAVIVFKRGDRRRRGAIGRGDCGAQLYKVCAWLGLQRRGTQRCLRCQGPCQFRAQAQRYTCGGEGFAEQVVVGRAAAGQRRHGIQQALVLHPTGAAGRFEQPSHPLAQVLT